MSDSLRQIGKGIGKSNVETKQNTARISANLPEVHRKLDIVAGSVPYNLEFALSSREHSAYLNIQIKPDNCCECGEGRIPGGTQFVSAVPTNFGPYGPITADSDTYGDGTDYPATYSSPMDQSNYPIDPGIIAAPWWSPIYQYPYDDLGTFGLTDGIVVPTDGIYLVLFKSVSQGQTRSRESSITASVKRKRGTGPWEIISQKIYSVKNNTLCWYTFDGEKVCGEGNFNSGMFGAVYAACVVLFKGDVVAGWLKPYDISNWHPLVGPQSGANVTNLLVRAWLNKTLTGTITDSLGNPLQGVTVSYTLENGASTTTDIQGHYFFDNLTTTTYSILATKTGYLSQARNITIVAGLNNILDFVLLV